MVQRDEFVFSIMNIVLAWASQGGLCFVHQAEWLFS
jgi:hypothetical protein